MAGAGLFTPYGDPLPVDDSAYQRRYQRRARDGAVSHSAGSAHERVAPCGGDAREHRARREERLRHPRSHDDGGGITEAGTTGPRSLGILGMRERAAVLGGVLEVAPRSGGGTRVAAWFPPAPHGHKRADR